MTLVEQLLEKEKYINLNYYGLNDMATGFEMKTIVENKDIISTYFSSNQNSKINSLDDYIEYNYALKILKMKEIIPNIIDQENKGVFSKVVKEVELYSDSVSPREVIRFINDNYKKIFEKQERILGLIDATLILFERYKSGIKTEVFKYIIENRAYLIIGHYGLFGSIIEKDEILLNLFFQKSIITSLFLQKQEEMQIILEKIYRKGILNNFEELIEELSEIVAAKYNDINDDNILANEISVRIFSEFLMKIKHIKANVFNVYYDNVKEKMDDYLKRKGHRSSYEIPIGEILKHLKSIEPKEYSLLTVSHGVQDGQLLSRLDFPSEGKHTIMDFASYNHKRDNYYTVSHIHRLEAGMTVGASTIHGIIFDDEMFEESRKCLIGYLFAVCELKKWEKEDYQDDVEIMYQMLNMCRQLPDIDNFDFRRGICYGTCAHICGVMEKILRDIYVDENKEEIFIDESQITIGQLLHNNSGTIRKIFNENHLKHLRYYLSTDTEQKIGFNYRNKIAHYTIDKRNLNVSFVARMLYLLVDVVNSIFLYVQV